MAKRELRLLACVAALIVPWSGVALTHECRDMVAGIARGIGASLADGTESGPWYVLSHPSFARVTVSCYGPETPPVAEIVFAEETASHVLYSTIGEAGAALLATSAEAIAADAELCATRADIEKNRGELQLQSEALSCLVSPRDGDAASTVTVYIDASKRGAETSATAPRPNQRTENPATRKASARHRIEAQAKVSHRNDCPWGFP